MQTTIDITDNIVPNPVHIIVGADSPAIPATGDDVSIPTPYTAPVPGAFQQLTISNRIYRFDPATAPPSLYVLLVTANPIT